MVSKQHVVLAVLALAAVVNATDLLGGRDLRCKTWLPNAVGLMDCPSDDTLKIVGVVCAAAAVYVYMNPSVVSRFL